MGQLDTVVGRPGAFAPECGNAAPVLSRAPHTFSTRPISYRRYMLHINHIISLHINHVISSISYRRNMLHNNHFISSISYHIVRYQPCNILNILLLHINHVISSISYRTSYQSTKVDQILAEYKLLPPRTIIFQALHYKERTLPELNIRLKS